MGFEFKHIKRTPVFPTATDRSSFGFIHKKREEVLVRKTGGFLYGAFDSSFDPDSFFVMDEAIPGFIAKINDFLFRHIKTT